MSQVIEKAKEKIEGEHKNFKEQIELMKSKDVYNMAGVIIFTEATVYHLAQLTESEALCELILKEDANLIGATQYIMTNVKNKYGQTGDLPVEEFHELIWDYYKIDHAAAKKAMEEKVEKIKREHQLLKTKNKDSNKKSNQISIMDVDVNSNVEIEKDINVDVKTETYTNMETEIEKEDLPNKNTSSKAGPLQISLFNI